MDISLHRHADCDRSLLRVLPHYFRLTHGDSQKYPFNPWHNHHEQIKKWFGNPLKGDIVKKFSLTTGVLQSFDVISMWAENFVDYMAGKGYKYCRVIFAPQYHVFSGLTEKEIVAAWVQGIKSGEDKNPGIKVNAFLGVGREVSSERAVELVNMFAECPDREYFPGVTLVCDEAKNPPEKHAAMLKRAKETQFIRACHASEWVHDPDVQEADFWRDLPRLLKNLRTAVLDLEVDVIEHGISLPYDPELMKTVIDKNIGVAMCPSSYVCTELLPKNDVRILRVEEMLNNGVKLFLDVDDDLAMEDMDEMHLRVGLNKENKEKMRINGWNMLFQQEKRI